ncbi:MAG: hypothetical protein KF726_04070 [Anaerolineae bacterium]|nr:hypothetical protein [Anaerolineae bacterium]
MSVGGLILFIAFLIAVVAIVLAPLLRSSPQKLKAQPTAADADLSSPLIGLEAQHQATLASLRDLDFDFQTGKLAEVDYHTQREFLMQRGADILRQIDLLAANNKAAPDPSPSPSSTPVRSARKRKA